MHQGVQGFRFFADSEVQRFRDSVFGAVKVLGFKYVVAGELEGRDDFELVGEFAQFFVKNAKGASANGNGFGAAIEHAVA